ncbi:DNA polymerase IV [Gordonia aichiensis]|uniref:DNA-directed DNA polymerase n=1 Tax=Gordonia aichiensis NBRC 108223 TaxID=1220583 RepID=L7KF61_9ACTN|nr:DNA polymerase IV [Gordonia aichiensis]GAC47126.1 DNA polymerase IV [Gordonia aichiensis NBRC 108223]
MSTDRPQRFRWLLHIDLDQFQVSVERLRSPELADVPIVVGGNGDPTEARKVVTCASYEARAHGVRAGMPLRAAHRKLPDAVFVPLDTEAYDAASAEVMDAIRGLGHPVEVWGWDEAYVGIEPLTDSARGGAESVGDATIIEFATRMRTAVLEATGLDSSVGISDNKQRAKMATEFAKKPDRLPPHDSAESATFMPVQPLPDKVFVLDDRNWLELMGHRRPRELWSVGPKTAEKLAAHHIDTVDDLIATPRDDLIAIFGAHQGNWLYVLCRGHGDSTITPEPWEARSHSKSRTFAADLVSATEKRTAAEQLVRELLDQVIAEGRVPFRVAVTVRTSTFYTRTKSRKLQAPTVDISELTPVVLELLDRFDADRPVRLLGVRMDLVPLDAQPVADTDLDLEET